MVLRRHLTGIIVLLSCMIVLTAGPVFSAANETDCMALKGYVEAQTDATFGMKITNVTATWVITNSGQTTFCQVTGWIWPETQFQVTLPGTGPTWNERYLMNGGGGWDGSLSVPSLPDSDGYAQSSANGGYMASNWPNDSGAFGLKEPYFSKYYDKASYPTGLGGYYGSVDPKGTGNPFACQKVVDFGIRHLKETPIIAKKIIRKYYGQKPKYSYYSGGSCGGKEGQISAQQFPDYYDGFYIGCPLGGHLAVTLRGTWDNYWATKSHLSDFTSPFCNFWLGCPTVYSTYKAQMHHDAVYNKCDSVDGLVDGLIDDPRECKFDPLADLPACTAAQEADGTGITSSTCFTLAQRQALKEIYTGPHTSFGKKWYPGQPLSAEYMGPDWFGGISSGFVFAINDGMAPGMFANIALRPPMGPEFDLMSFNWDTDPKAAQRTTCRQCYDNGRCETFNIHDVLDGITISPYPAPNMGGFEPVYRKGVKIVQTHGWGDSLVSALAASTGLYETVMNTMGAHRTKSFYKLYMVPGAGHCGGGIGAYPTDGFSAMVEWVEQGKEPGALIGTGYYPTEFTRPICPYPEVARYTGTGSTTDAANFSCVPPVSVRIEPETLNLKSKGVFTAVISVPEGYDIRDWNIHNVSCEGAPAVNGMVAGRNVYVAKFKRQDLENVSPGWAVTLTVKLAFLHDGKEALTQASDTVRVINTTWPKK